MATKQRENARRERAQKKDLATKKIIWILLILVIIALIIMKVCEIDFSAVKNRFTDSDGNFTLTVTADEDAYPYQIDSSRAIVNSINDKLNILTPSTVTVMNPASAQVMYSFTHGYSNPVLSYSGNYYCIYDQGSDRIRLDTNSENIYETVSEYQILCADVAKNGTVAYASRSDESKSRLVVINTSLKEKMVYEFNDGYIVAVAIDSSGTKCAFAAVNTEDAKLVTTVYTMSVGEFEQPKYSFKFPSANTMSLHYSDSSDLYFVSTDGVCLIENQKKQKEIFKQGTVKTVCYCYTHSNELVYAFSSFSGSNECTVSYVTTSGKVKSSAKFNQTVKYLSSEANEYSVLLSDRIVTCSLSKGVERNSVKCDDSVKSAHRMSSKMFVNRQQLIDIL